MCKYYENRSISISDLDYQIIHLDQELMDKGEPQETIIKARFNRNNVGAIQTVDFKLLNVNVNPNKAKFKIHFAVWCPKRKRVELHISYHPNYNKNFYESFDQLENEITLALHQKLQICLRITPNKTFSDMTICSSTIKPTPDDKDGSILIGTN